MATSCFSDPRFSGCVFKANSDRRLRQEPEAVFNKMVHPEKVYHFVIDRNHQLCVKVAADRVATAIGFAGPWPAVYGWCACLKRKPRPCHAVKTFAVVAPYVKILLVGNIVQIGKQL